MLYNYNNSRLSFESRKLMKYDMQWSYMPSTPKTVHIKKEDAPIKNQKLIYK